MAAKYTSDRAPALRRAHFQFQQASARAQMDEPHVDRMNSSCSVFKNGASRLGYNRIETRSGGNQEDSTFLGDASQEPWLRSPGKLNLRVHQARGRLIARCNGIMASVACTRNLVCAAGVRPCCHRAQAAD